MRYDQEHRARHPLKFRGFRFSFSLRTLFVVVLIAGPLLGWQFRREYNRRRTIERGLAWIAKHQDPSWKLTAVPSAMRREWAATAMAGPVLLAPVGSAGASTTTLAIQAERP
jgi:hypothetical protein